jgi:hypothetical protein
MLYIRSSNPLCAPASLGSVPGVAFTDYTEDIVNTFAAKGLEPGSTRPSVDVSQIKIQEADKPNVLIDFADSHESTGENLTAVPR